MTAIRRLAPTRRLAAILAADVVGYSRLIGADEDGTLARLKALRAELIDPRIAERHGRIVKTTGDGMLVEFGRVKTVDLELRPVFHWTAPRVRAHVLLCMLAYYLQWHMRRSLATMLFDEPDPAAREAQRTSPVAKAEPSPAARRKAARKCTEVADGEPLPVHSFHTLLGDLATLTRNVVRLGRDRLTAILATPTRTQHRALDLLGVTPTA